MPLLARRREVDKPRGEARTSDLATRRAARQRSARRRRPGLSRFILMNPLVIPSGGTNLNILGIPMVVRLRGSDTGGIVGVAESHDVAGSGPPLHIHHREDETFQVLEGEYEWTVGDKTFVAGKGTTIFAPRGIPHGYRYIGTETGRLMCTITPAGFEGFFEEVGALSPEEQQDLPRILAIAATYGLEFLPPPGS